MKKFFKRIVKSLCAIMPSVVMFSAYSCGVPGGTSESSGGGKATLKGMTMERQSDEFKILQLTDIQIIDPSQQPYDGRLNQTDEVCWADRDKNAFNLVKRLVSETDPDWIILTGDNVYGQFDKDGSNFVALVELMESFKKPWSFVNGNHDGEYYIVHGGERVECGKGMRWQADYVKNNTQYCMFDSGDEEMGYGNYVIHLTENEKPVFSFYMTDTHGCAGYSAAGLTDGQVKWYEESVKNACDVAGKVVPSFVYMHIPTKEFYRAMVDYTEVNDIGMISKDGLPAENGDYGMNMENVTYFYSAEFWAKVKELDSTKGIFAGHNHTNNSSLMYEGVRLTFGTKTGTYDYNYQQGGTLTTINRNGTFSVVPVYDSEGGAYGKK